MKEQQMNGLNDVVSSTRRYKRNAVELSLRGEGTVKALGRGPGLSSDRAPSGGAGFIAHAFRDGGVQARPENQTGRRGQTAVVC